MPVLQQLNNEWKLVTLLCVQIKAKPTIEPACSVMMGVKSMPSNTRSVGS